MTIMSPGSGAPCRSCPVEGRWLGETLVSNLQLHREPARSPCSGQLLQTRLSFAIKNLHDWQTSGQINKTEAQKEAYEGGGGLEAPDLDPTEYLWRQLKLPVTTNPETWRVSGKRSGSDSCRDVTKKNISSTFRNVTAQNLLIFDVFGILIVASEKLKSQPNRSPNICEHLWTISPSLWAGINICAASPTFSYFHLWPEHPTPPAGIKPNLQHWAAGHRWGGGPAWWAQVSTVWRVLLKEISWLIVKLWQH